jgi:hypothetical protein
MADRGALQAPFLLSCAVIEDVVAEARNLSQGLIDQRISKRCLRRATACKAVTQVGTESVFLAKGV